VSALAPPPRVLHGKRTRTFFQRNCVRSRLVPLHFGFCNPTQQKQLNENRQS
jgi:hypothetical protein